MDNFKLLVPGLRMGESVLLSRAVFLRTGEVAENKFPLYFTFDLSKEQSVFLLDHLLEPQLLGNFAKLLLFLLQAI